MQHVEEDPREKILEAAAEIFSQFGFKKATMEQIAQATYKGKSAIYYYFKSKEALFLAVVKKEGQILKQALEKAVASEKTPLTKLQAYFETRMMEFFRHPNIYNAIKDKDLQHYGFIQNIRRNGLQYELEMIEKILNEGLQKDIFVIKDPKLTAEGLLTVFSGVESMWDAKTQFPKIKRSISIVLDMLFYGMMA